MKIVNRSASSRSSPNACTDCTTPGPRHERAEDGEKERDDDQGDVPYPQHAALLLHAHRVQERGRGEPRQQAGVLDRIPHPVAAPPQLLVGPQHAEREAERQEQPPDHRPAPHRAKPRVVEMAGDERGEPERERHRHRHEPDVHRRRVNGHVEVLEQRREAGALRRAAVVRNVENGLLWMTIRKMKNISVAASTDTT